MLPTQQNLDLARDYAEVFSTPQGKRVLEHLLNDLCGVNQVVPLNNPNLNLGIVCGARNVGIRIMDLIKMRFDEAPTVKRHK